MSTSAGRVLVLPKGNYNASTTYNMLDCVYYNGRSYLCKQTSTGNAPTNTTYWQPMTADSSAEIQALTNYTADTGVKNLLNIYDEKSMSGNVNLTIENNGYSIVVSTSSQWQSVRQWIRGLKKNTDYVLSFNFTMESGSPYAFIDNSDGTTIAGLNPPTTGSNVLNFNTGNYTDFQFYFYCISATAGTGSVHYADIMVCEKAVYDADPTYQPYAMTNKELTDAKANKSDLTSISITGTTNNTGSTIVAGTCFYLNGALVKAKADIANGATLTANTNYEAVTDGGFNLINSALISLFKPSARVTSANDMNSISNGVYYQSNDNCPTNAPTDTTDPFNAVIFQFQQGGENRYFQIWISANTTTIYYRRYSGSWSAWHKVTAP